MSICLGIDPDTKYVALAMTSETQVLAVRSVKACPDSILQALSIQIPDFVKAQALDSIWPLRIVVEGQKIYPGSKVRPNDLILLAQVAGMAAGVCAAHFPDKELFIPEPSGWKGSVKKAIYQARLFHTLGWGFKKARDYAYPLKPSVGQCIPRGEWKHVGDAIGLAMWGANR